MDSTQRSPGGFRPRIMTEELELRRKYTLRAHGKQMVFIKKSFESRTHVLTKAFLWALYLPDYPDLAVEVPVGGRYKPDLVQFDDNIPSNLRENLLYRTFCKCAAWSRRRTGNIMIPDRKQTNG